mgnify:CR=1 FL=1
MFSFGDLVPNWVQAGLDYLHVSGWLESLIIDGIVAGVGTVLGFLPQIFVLFICLGILEDIGYMILFITKKGLRLFIMFKDYLKKTYPVYLLYLLFVLCYFCCFNDMSNDFRFNYLYVKSLFFYHPSLFFT